MLYNAMMSVPIKARETIQILQVPSDKKLLKAYVTYYDKASIDWLCFGKKANLDDVYDPFRDAHSALFHSDDSDNAISYDDYQGIQDFHPFSLLDNQAVATPCFYQDPKKQANCSAIDGLVLSWAAAQNQLETRQSAQCTLALVGCSD